MPRASRPSLHLAVLGGLPRLVRGLLFALLATISTRRIARCWPVSLCVGLGAVAGLAALRTPRAASRTELPDLRVAAVNLLYSNPCVELAAVSVAARDLDVLVLSECPPGAAEVFSRHIPLIAHTTFGPGGVAVFSRLPANPSGVLQLEDRDLPLVTVRHERGPVHVVGVHLQAPTRTQHIRPWRSQLAALQRHLREQPGRVVLAGDFNASAQHVPFRRLLNARRDLHPGTTRATYPARCPLLDLDHTVTDLTVLDATRFRVPGSDHLGIEVSLRFPGTARTLA